MTAALSGIRPLVTDAGMDPPLLQRHQGIHRPGTAPPAARIGRIDRSREGGAGICPDARPRLLLCIDLDRDPRVRIAFPSTACRTAD